MTDRGALLGVDVGSVRVGIAVSDPARILATPVVTLAREPSADSLAAIAALIRDYEAVAVVVGLPINLAGAHGPAARATKGYAQELASLIDPVPVHLTDERMSTVVATRRLSDAGMRGRRQRAVVDQAAAVEILQGWLDAQRASSSLNTRRAAGTCSGGDRAD